MRVEFFGVRGTTPLTTGAATAFGRNTSCLAVTSAAGDLLIFDAGTGLEALGRRLRETGGRAPRRIHLFLTHVHFDHIQGLPFFAPLYAAGAEIVFTSAFPARRLRRNLVRFMSPPFFPARFAGTASSKTFRRLGRDPVVIGGMTVSACPLRHPQSSFAYRLAEGAFSLVLATDTEHPPSGLDERLAAFSRGASVLVYDAMYTPEEYEARRRGWGHSTWAAGVRLARAAGVERLLLFHLNPDYSDADLEGIEGLARAEFPAAVCAREGMLETETIGR